jgi:hypothetical protein
MTSSIKITLSIFAVFHLNPWRHTTSSVFTISPYKAAKKKYFLIRETSSPTGLGHFWGPDPLATPPDNSPPQCLVPTRIVYLTLGAVPLRPFSRMLALFGPGPPVIVDPGFLPHEPHLPCIGYQAWAPLCFKQPGCNINARIT